MKYLTHCTTFINALHILLEKTVKFGNLRLSNDEEEAELHGDDRTTLYSFCLFMGSCDDISSIMWLAYSGRINGASITFCFEDSVNLNELFYSNEEIACFPVQYDENEVELIAEDYSLFGHIKNQKFADEKEYRFLIKKDWIDDSSHLYQNINFDCVKKIILCVDPKLENICKIIFKDNKLIEIKINSYLR